MLPMYATVRLGIYEKQLKQKGVRIGKWRRQIGLLDWVLIFIGRV